jgi:glycosyltransferase involved in cell wall biosynthesis
MLELAGNGQLVIHGAGRYVPFKEITALYRGGGWLAGLALFPDTPHYREKELTKFFEYMAFGLPIVASDFPAWKALIEGHGVGLCVNAGSTGSINAGLIWLREHPDEARAMGERGRTLVRTTFNWEREAARLVEFYQTLR